MVTYEIISPELVNFTLESMMEYLEELIRNCALTIHRKTTLASYKGSVHYHLVKPGEKGVLEITFWPKQPRLWLDIASNRQALWNHAMIEEISSVLAEKLDGDVRRTT